MTFELQELYLAWNSAPTRTLPRLELCPDWNSALIGTLLLLEQGQILIVCFYVDDMIFTENMSVDKFKSSMKQEFEMTN